MLTQIEITLYLMWNSFTLCLYNLSQCTRFIAVTGWHYVSNHSFQENHSRHSGQIVLCDEETSIRRIKITLYIKLIKCYVWQCMWFGLRIEEIHVRMTKWTMSNKMNHRYMLHPTKMIHVLHYLNIVQLKSQLDVQMPGPTYKQMLK